MPKAFLVKYRYSCRHLNFEKILCNATASSLNMNKISLFFYVSEMLRLSTGFYGDLRLGEYQV